MTTLHSDMVLVTGAAGLLGRELVRQLGAGGIRVRALDLRGGNEPPAAQAVVGDLLDPAVCAGACAGARTVVHCAARQHHSGVPRWGHRRFFAANVEMTRNLVEASVAAGVGHFVFVSSDMVYGIPRTAPVGEDEAAYPIGPYGWSKLACEKICIAARSRGMRVTILRPRLIIGPGRLGVLQKLFDRIRHGRFVPLIGDGENRYQMVSVSDVAVACMLAVTRAQEGTFNLGSEDPPRVRALLSDLCRRAGSGARIQSTPLRLTCAALNSLHLVRLAPLNPEQFRIAGVDYVLDTSRARRELGWRPRLTDADMLWSAYDTYVRGLAGQGQRLESVPT